VSGSERHMSNSGSYIYAAPAARKFRDLRAVYDADGGSG
jgi:hypothetical protein